MENAFDLTQKQQLFITALRESGTIRKAAELAHVGRSTVQRWREENINGFRGQFDDAMDHFTDGLEDKMFALLGEMKVGHNPTLMIFALKALRPLKYRELTQVQDEHARALLKKLETFTAKAAKEIEGGRGKSELTALEQVQEILKQGDEA